MHRLQETAQDVHQEFMNGNHPVKRSKDKFNQVWCDMALEQSVNRDSKTKDGIVGITLQKNALDRWFLTARMRAAVTSAIKEIYSISNDDEQVSELNHKETGKERRCRTNVMFKACFRLLLSKLSIPLKGVM